MKTYSKQQIAQGIATKLTRQTGRKHQVVTVADGFQVALVVDKPMPKVLNSRLPVVVTLPFVSESPHYLTVVFGDQTSFISKNAADDWRIDPETGRVTVRMPLGLARRKGFSYELAEA